MRNVFEVIVKFLEKLDIAYKDVPRFTTDIDRFNELASTELNLCGHATGTKIILTITNIDAADGCSFCRKNEPAKKEK